jgi:hypothetical protein
MSGLSKNRLDALAHDEDNDTGLERDEIYLWAVEDAGLNLPSARAFTAWLDQVWSEFGDEDDTNRDVLYGALNDWTGGRA